MAKRRGLYLLMLSLVLGAGAAWVANNWVVGRLMPSAEADVNMATVVAAAIAIPYATKVSGLHLTLIQVPTALKPEGAYADISEVEGKVSMTAISRGEILVTERFAGHERGSTLAVLVKANMRAVTVRVNDVVGVAGFLLPGNHVDVLSARKQEKRAVTETILHDIKVLAVDQTAATDKNEPTVVRAVTLEMTPDNAEILFKAQTEGTIQLTLRNPLEPEYVPPPAPPPKPVVVRKATPRPASDDTMVTVIRGTQVKRTKTKP